MMKQLKRIKRLKSGSQKALACFAVVITMAFVGTATPAKAVAKPELVVRSAIAIDADSGQILYQKQAQKALPIASVTKLLATYIVLEQIKSGKLTWQTPVKIDSATAKLSHRSILTNVPLTAGHQYSVRQLYKATLIYSANAAVTALGTKIAGSAQKFLTKMRETALKLGLTSAKIVTASGITNGQAGHQLGDPKVGAKVENKMSAIDVAKLSQRLITDFPAVLHTTGLQTAWFDKGGSSQTAMTNWNLMLKGGSQATSNLPVDGLKTGTSTAAGGNFVGTVNKQGHRLITVVMHAGNGSSGDATRFVQTRRLMKWVYATYRPVKMAIGAKVAGADSVKAFYGKAKTADIALAQSTTLWMKKTQQKSTIAGQLQLAKSATEKDGLKTPVKKGTHVGRILLKIDGQKVASVDGSATVPAKVGQADDRVNWFVRLWRDFTALF
ncbi:D-alanyl-D-alanine carboxypeptidase family protein [uncultured Secundilactobacillus sp.]|uniref:D-alanyl-D-alanine carboxypeptidase family protein n=1 Tax=uncultured Secundilactobacillus sp. TaxID=2813935 RepID=UPI00258D2B33|nr:D-alanyl-D-alanine carboxypeptidase family protein [uncultured Secundilactobacillus sp.]